MGSRCSGSTATSSWTGCTAGTRTAAAGGWPATSTTTSSGTASWTGTGPAWLDPPSSDAGTWASVRSHPAPRPPIRRPRKSASPPVACCASCAWACTYSWDVLACGSPAAVQLLPRTADGLVASDFAIFFLKHAKSHVIDIVCFQTLKYDSNFIIILNMTFPEGSQECAHRSKLPVLWPIVFLFNRQLYTNSM